MSNSVRLIKKGTKQVEVKALPTKKQKTAEEIRTEWLADRKKSQIDSATLRKQIFGR